MEICSRLIIFFRLILVRVLWIDLSQAACRSLRPLELEFESVSVGELELERSSSLDTDIDIGAGAGLRLSPSDVRPPTWCNNRHHLFCFKQKLLASASNKVWLARKESRQFGNKGKSFRLASNTDFARKTLIFVSLQNVLAVSLTSLSSLSWCLRCLVCLRAMYSGLAGSGRRAHSARTRTAGAWGAAAATCFLLLASSEVPLLLNRTRSSEEEVALSRAWTS